MLPKDHVNNRLIFTEHIEFTRFLSYNFSHRLSFVGKLSRFWWRKVTNLYFERRLRMKRIILFLTGFFPLLLGYLQNHLMMTVFFNNSMPYLLISSALLVIWFFASGISVKFFSSKKEVVILLNSAAFLALLLILFQEIVLGRYWMNHIGIASQLFYLPLLNLAYRFSFMFSRVFYADIIAFVLLLISSYLGRVTGERWRK